MIILVNVQISYKKKRKKELINMERYFVLSIFLYASSGSRPN